MPRLGPFIQPFAVSWSWTKAKPGPCRGERGRSHPARGPAGDAAGDADRHCGRLQARKPESRVGDVFIMFMKIPSKNGWTWMRSGGTPMTWEIFILHIYLHRWCVLYIYIYIYIYTYIHRIYMCLCVCLVVHSTSFSPQDVFRHSGSTTAIH